MSGGTDRVPSHLSVHQAPPAYIHRVFKERAGALGEIRTNPPYVNPKRDVKSAKSGRLRKDRA